jgi:histidyl-tRNA synthetase
MAGPTRLHQLALLLVCCDDFCAAVRPEMTEKRQFRAIKGTRDILPPDSALWNWFEQAAREVFETYSFRDIRLPILEKEDLFARSVGTDTDIVSKEMFRFDLQAFQEIRRPLGELITSGDNPLRFTGWLYELIRAVKWAWESDRMERSEPHRRAIEILEGGYKQLYERIADDQVLSQMEQHPEMHPEIYDLMRETKLSAMGIRVFPDMAVLRPEATASVARAYIEHGMQTLPGNVKLYYVGPMFRRERPQKGRYRQFFQVGAEVLGQSDAPAIDAEVLEMLMVLFKRVGLTSTTLYVNSIGCKECRPKYVELLREELRKVQDQLGADSQRRIETNPLRVLDSKLPNEQPIIEKLPRISDHLCADCREHFAKLKEELKLREIAYEENWRLVRGLDYYTRTTFEVTAAGLGSQNAVCGGGRYDGLVELLGGPPTKGIGFAIGTDRAILSIQGGANLPHLAGLAVFIARMGATAYPTAVNIAKKLRARGFAVELPGEEMKFKKALGLADKLGVRYALIIGEDEVASGTYTLKRLSDGDQKKLTENELLEHLEAERRGKGA